MVSGPPCMIHNDMNSFELHILQGVHCPASRNSYFSYFLAKFLLFSNILLLFLLFDQIPTFTTFYNEDNNFVK